MWLAHIVDNFHNLACHIDSVLSNLEFRPSPFNHEHKKTSMYILWGPNGNVSSDYFRSRHSDPVLD